MKFKRNESYRMHLLGGLIAVCAVALWSPAPVLAVPQTLQSGTELSGNQDYSGVGVKFHVNSSVDVTDLGIFDSGQNGITSGTTLSAFLMTSVGVTLASQTFDNASPGTLDGRYRFKSIPVTTLAPGDYVLAGYGWTPTDQEHNCNIGGACEVFNTGGGLLTYVSSPYGGGTDPAGTLPTNECCGNLNFFAAANMKFDATPTNGAVPEPATLLLLGSGLVGLAAWRRKKPAA